MNYFEILEYGAFSITVNGRMQRGYAKTWVGLKATLHYVCQGG